MVPTAEKALRCSYHLACVRGPDRGAVLPLADGDMLGRADSALEDPTLAPQHCRVRLFPGQERRRPGSTVGYLQELPGVASSLSPQVRWPGRVPAGACPLRLRRKLALGANLWQVRIRPRDARWPRPASGGWSRVRQFLPFLFIGLLLWRWGGPMLLGGLLLVAVLWRRQPKDAARLLLVVAAQARAGVSANAPADVGLWQGARRSCRVRPGETLGVVGSAADACWFAAQFQVLWPGVAPQVSFEGADTVRAHVGEDLLFEVAWAPTAASLPPHCVQVFDGVGWCGPSWVRQVSECWNPPSSPESTLDTPPMPNLGLPTTPEQIRDCWDRFSGGWDAPVGVAVDTGEPVFVDLLGDGPHAIMVGSTGSGKSVALRTWLVSLALRVPPQSLRMVLVDFKGGAGLAELASLPHVEHCLTDLEPSGTTWLLRRLHHVLQDRKALLQQSGFRDLSEWRGVGQPPRLLVVIDEFQAFAEDNPDFLGSLSRLAAQGRSLGFHLVVSSQRPGRALGAELRDNLDLRISLRCTEAQTSREVRGDDQAANLPRLPGRALLGDTELHFAALPVPDMPPAFVPVAPLWPPALPEDGSAHPPVPEKQLGRVFLGWSESPSHRGSPTEMWWEGQALLLAGTPHLAETLCELAQMWVWNLALAGDVPPHVVGLATAPTTRGWETAATFDQLEQIARCWTRVVTEDGCLLLVVEPTTILQEFAAAGLGAEAETLWSQVLQRARAGALRLLVVDTQGNARCAGIACRLLFAVTEADWGSPALWRVAPSRAGEFSRAEATGSLPGRGWAAGWSGPDRPWQRAPLGTWQPPEDDAPSPQRAGQIFPISWHFPGTIVSIASFSAFTETDQEMTFVGEPPRDFGTSNWVPTERWMGALSQTDHPTVLLRPTLEMVRYLAQRRPNMALWLRSLLPFAPGLSLLVTGSDVAVLVMGTERVSDEPP